MRWTAPIRCASSADAFICRAARHAKRLSISCGNSLGLQPKGVAGLLQQELDDWAQLGVKGHHSAQRPWLPYHEHLAADTALLVGARPHEVVTMNTLTVNLHLMMVSFYRPTRERHVHSDRARRLSVGPLRRRVADRLSRLSTRARRCSSSRRAPARACVRHGRHRGAARARRRAHRARAAARRAVPHRAGVRHRRASRGRARAGLPRRLRPRARGRQPRAARCTTGTPDFAVWCSYKYLNAGPGAVGGCFVHERHARSLDLPRFAGWWGHDRKRASSWSRISSCSRARKAGSSATRRSSRSRR